MKLLFTLALAQAFVTSIVRAAIFQTVRDARFSLQTFYFNDS